METSHWLCVRVIAFWYQEQQMRDKWETLALRTLMFRMLYARAEYYYLNCLLYILTTNLKSQIISNKLSCLNLTYLRY